MENIERIPFDFSGEAAMENLTMLEDMLSSGHWSTRYLNYRDGRTALLMRLLHIRGISVFKRAYTPNKDVSEELRNKARIISGIMHKQSVGQTLIDIASIFADRQYDVSKTVFNSLFFPELKAFVRCGGIPPDRLLDLLERDGCDKVFLFPDAYGEDYYYAFIRSMPLKDFLKAIEEERAEVLAAMSEALRRVEYDGVIPTVWQDEAE